MFFNPLDNRNLYTIYDFNMRLLQPYSDYCEDMAKRFLRVADNLNLPIKIPYIEKDFHDTFSNLLETTASYFRRLSGYSYIFHMMSNVYDKPKFHINAIKINNEYYDVQEECIDRKSFCDLIRFKKTNGEHLNLPKMLLVAPMSGHYATLLRDTVYNLLPLYDVYITDWKNARDVPLTEGSFDLDDYIDYMIFYLNLLAPNVNIMAVCQPTVPVLAAIALMSTNNSPNLPSTAILLGGPIDTSQSPTLINELAASRGDDWFHQNVITIVPSRFPGSMRLVYPGFMQLAGFMSMNVQRHIESLQRAVDRYAENQKVAAFKIIEFYLEYFSTMDLTAEFYMQTINTVFQEKLLTTGRYKSSGHNVRLQDIKKTAILAIEGERDDITGIGQTKSVITLCNNLPDSMKEYYLAKEVGHYGLFNGKKFRTVIIPQINAFTQSHKNQ